MEKENDNTEDVWELEVLKINETTGEVSSKPFLLNITENPILNSEPETIKVGNKLIKYTKVKLHSGRVIKVAIKYNEFKSLYLQKLKELRISNNNSEGVPIFLN